MRALRDLNQRPFALLARYERISEVITPSDITKFFAKHWNTGSRNIHKVPERNWLLKRAHRNLSSSMKDNMV